MWNGAGAGPDALKSGQTRVACQQSAVSSQLVTGRWSPNGIGFVGGGGAGRAKLLLSRIPAASTAPIPAAP
jgi:hypothetical protein